MIKISQKQNPSSYLCSRLLLLIFSIQQKLVMFKLSTKVISMTGSKQVISKVQIKCHSQVSLAPSPKLLLKRLQPLMVIDN